MEGTVQQTPAIDAQAPPAVYLPRQRWIDLGLVMLISFVPSIVGATHEMFYPSGRRLARSNFGFAMGLVNMASCLLLLLYIFARQKRTLKSIGLGFHWTDFFAALWLTFVAIFLVLLQNIGVRMVASHFLGRPADIRNPDFETGVLAPLILAYSIASPIFEEVLVRGYLMTELIELRQPLWLATVASILVQTSYHVYYGFAGAVSLSGFFILLAVYFAFSRRLLPVILAHMYWDVGVFLIRHH